MGKKVSMEQDVEQYWPQHKVFFLATLVLFPDKLTVRALDPWFFRPYFNFTSDSNFGSGRHKDPSLDWVIIMLDDYQNKGYIKYNKADSLYKITEIDTKKATKDLVQYLKKWQHNKLLSLPAFKPPDTAHQQALLLDAVVRAYANYQNEPRITLEDVYGKHGDYAYEPPFWELVLSYQLLDNRVKIKYMDYGRRTDGLYDDNAQPLVDFKITDKELVSLVEQRVAQKATPLPPTAPASIVVAQPMVGANDAELQSVTVAMTVAGVIYAKLGDEKRLIKRVRPDSAPYNFFDYTAWPPEPRCPTRHYSD